MNKRLLIYFLVGINIGMALVIAALIYYLLH